MLRKSAACVCGLFIFFPPNVVCLHGWLTSQQQQAQRPNDFEAKRCAILVVLVAANFPRISNHNEKKWKTTFSKSEIYRNESIRLNDIDVTFKKVTCRYAIAVRTLLTDTHTHYRSRCCCYCCCCCILPKQITCVYMAHTHTCGRSSNEKQRIRVQIRWTQLENRTMKKNIRTHLTAAATTTKW